MKLFTRMQNESSQRNMTVSIFLKRITQDVFVVSLLTYLSFYLIESLIPNFISSQFSLNILLAVSVVSGIAVVLLGPDEPSAAHKRMRFRFGFVTFIIVLGFAGGAIVWFRTISLGVLSVPLGVLSGIVIMLLSFALMIDDKDANNHKSQDV